MSSEDVSDMDVLSQCWEGKERCPTDRLSTNDKASVSHWLARFVTEARRQDGKPYPPKTIHMFII